MWKVKLPTKNKAISELITALTYADGTPKYAMSAQQEHAIKTAYMAYERAKGITNTNLLCTSFGDDFLNAIHSGYNEVQKKGRLADLRDRLMANADLCPCCGIGPVDELDHHLPQSLYKAFSVYSSNLVPICHKCNNLKRAMTGTSPDERFIHVYYDEIPQNAQFLYSTVQLDGRKLRFDFQIRKIPELSDQLYKQLSYQIGRVHLNDRLIGELNIFLDPLGYAIQKDFETGGKHAVGQLLNGTAKNLRRQYGLNHWRPVVIQALADHDTFCNGGFYKPLSLVRST